MQEGRFRLAIRKKLFIMRVVRQGNRLHRDVDTQSLAELKARLEQPGLVEGVTAHSSERQNKLINLLINKAGMELNYF